MLGEVIDLLACPACRSELDVDDGVAQCLRGHRFDVARQGYVSLLDGGSTKFVGDSAEMIAARARFLGSGHFDPLMRTLAAACVESAPDPEPARLVEIGAGTGQYLTYVLDRLPHSRAVALDVSKFAARRAARAHENIGSIVADAWQPWPLRDSSLSHVLCVFAPRNGAQSHRVLDDGGVLVVLTPTERHLRELIGDLDMVRVDDRKVERLESSMAGLFDRVDSSVVEYVAVLSRADVLDLVGMGPTARHRSAADLSAAVANLPETIRVTVSATVTVYRKQ
ncbi:23S rRNA (guanine745-N1)-methyltransferase [Rhodococcus sp. 27YEA15]|uniref:putative RNA methyltransferase n=1 Tax=Rhodococcus sp. 27YEA15 TaxID=3156259 RepID=UPI003C79938D